MSVVSAGLRRVSGRSGGLHVLEEDDDEDVNSSTSEDDEDSSSKNGNDVSVVEMATVIDLVLVQPKSLQECRIVYQDAMQQSPHSNGVVVKKEGMLTEDEIIGKVRISFGPCHSSCPPSHFRPRSPSPVISVPSFPL